MTIRYQRVPGDVTLAEMREFASFPSRTQRYIRRSLDVLAERGIEAVEFDGHVSDPHLLPVWTRLEPSGRWFHLVEVPAFRPRPTTRAPR